jgi:hypothetical protein
MMPHFSGYKNKTMHREVKMSTEVTYVKTPKGIEEMTSRCHGLSQRFRRVLIMLDGKRGEAEISAMFPDGEGETAMKAMISEGFIAPLNSVSTTSSTAKQADRVAPPIDDAERFEMAKNFMRNTIDKYLGGMGTGLMNQIGKCTTQDELRSHYKTWQESMMMTRESKAQIKDLESRLAALLS